MISHCSTSSLTLAVVSVLYFKDSKRHIVVCHCFNLMSPDDMWYQALFHICHLYIFFGEVSCPDILPLLNFLSFWLSRVLCVFWMRLSSDMCFAYIFSQLVTCLFILLTMSLCRAGVFDLHNVMLFFFFSFMDHALVLYLNKSPNLMSPLFSLMLPSRILEFCILHSSLWSILR